MIDLGPLNFLTQYDLLGAALILVGSLVVSKIVNLILSAVVHHFTKRTKTTLDDEMVKAVRRPIFLAILLLGLYLAAESIHYLASFGMVIDKIAVVLAIIVMFYAVVRIINGVFRWYATEIAAKTKSDLDDKYLSIFKRVLDIFLFVIAGMIVLKYLGIEITPLLAGLGIGGLAVALALQDTLANFFAGFYILTDKSIRVGDYVELENGMGGYVDDISWRTTRVRTTSDNYVIAPNSKLAQSITTNYHFGKSEMWVTITVALAVESDLAKAEKAALDAATDVQKRVPGIVKGSEAVVRFKEFADIGIKLNISLKIHKYSDQFIVRHELIKALKRGFDKNRIEISVPYVNVRK